MSQPAEDLISSVYPPPPLFYKYFTEENLSLLKDKKQAGEPVEGELKLLEPPEVPEGTHYRGYGNIWSFEDKLPKLSEMGLQQLYKDDESNENKIQELHKLMKSLLVNFVELLGIMHVNPSEFHLKIEDLKVILININHILNSYRPHQSKELLIMLLKQRIEDKKQEIANIDNKVDEIKLQLKELINFDQIKLGDHTETNDDNEDVKNEIIAKLLKDI